MQSNCAVPVWSKNVSLHTNRADPRPQAGRCPRQHTAESQLDMAHCSPQLYQRPERKSAFFAVAIQERLRSAYCAATSIKTSNPVLCHCHPSSLDWNSKLVSPGFLPWLLIHLSPLSSVSCVALAGATQGQSKPELSFYSSILNFANNAENHCITSEKKT